MRLKSTNARVKSDVHPYVSKTTSLNELSAHERTSKNGLERSLERSLAFFVVERVLQTSPIRQKVGCKSTLEAANMRATVIYYAAALLANRCASLEPVRIARAVLQPTRAAPELQQRDAARREMLQTATARRAVLQTAILAAATAPALASANIGGADYVIGGARLSEATLNPEGEVVVRLPREAAEALARAATDYGAVGEAFAAEDGAAAAQVQAYFRAGGGYDALALAVRAVATDKEAFPKSVRKAAGAFLDATAATLESYNTGDFGKALTQYESALTILAGFCTRVGIVAGAPMAKPAKAPVTRRTYLPGPFQLI